MKYKERLIKEEMEQDNWQEINVEDLDENIYIHGKKIDKLPKNFFTVSKKMIPILDEQLGIEDKEKKVLSDYKDTDCVLS